MDYAVFAVVAVVFISGCTAAVNQPTTNKTELGAVEAACEQAGGRWNECSSPCLGEPSTAVCIHVCVPQCECGGQQNMKCPEGYRCKLAGEGQNELGACIKAAVHK